MAEIHRRDGERAAEHQRAIQAKIDQKDQSKGDKEKAARGDASRRAAVC